MALTDLLVLHKTESLLLSVTISLAVLGFIVYSARYLSDFTDYTKIDCATCGSNILLLSVLNGFGL